MSNKTGVDAVAGAAGRGTRSATKQAGEPIHNFIAGVLRDRIMSGTYGDTGGLPPEVELMEEFKVSRHTIRASLQTLVLDGLIERFRGKGTVITKRAGVGSAAWEIRSLQDMLGELRDAEVLFAGPVAASSYPEVADKFSAGSRERLFKLVRVLKSPQGRYGLSVVFAKAEHGARVPREQLGKRSFVEALEQYAGVKATRVRQLSTAGRPSPAAMDALSVAETDPMLILKRSFFTAYGDLIGISEMQCRPDLYSQVLELMRDEGAKPVDIS